MTRGFLSRLAMFLFGQSLSAAGSALMVAIGLGADAYNVMIQGLSGAAHIRHGTMSSVMLFLLLLPALRRGRSRIGPGTVISIFLVGGVVNLVQPVFSPLRFAPLAGRRSAGRLTRAFFPCYNHIDPFFRMTAGFWENIMTIRTECHEYQFFTHAQQHHAGGK